MNNLLDMAAMEPEALSLMMGEPEGNVNTLRQVTGRKKRAKSITAQDYLNAMRSQSRKQMTHNEFKGSGVHPLDTFALSTMAIPGVGDVAGLAADARGYMSGDLKPTKLNMGMTAMGALPFVPGAMGGMVKAYHGTPHKVDKFKMDKIGTGEGAQAYGHGLYFAENKNVANQYKEDLSRGLDSTVSGGGASLEIPDWMAKIVDDDGIDRAIDEWTRRIKTAKKDIKVSRQPWNIQDNINRMSKDLDTMQEIKKSGQLSVDFQRGNLYNVNLDVNPEDLLDWDAPLSEQSEKVKVALQDTLDNLTNTQTDFKKASKLSRLSLNDELTGQQIIEEIKNILGDHPKIIDQDVPFGSIPQGRSEVASQALNEAGIPGIQYYDGASRSAGEGTRNYVMFDEDLIEINNPSSLNDLVKPQGKLPMDEASRMKRAEEMGFNRDVYHATTHDIDSFDPKLANPESDLGAGIYTTNTYDDALANYSSLEGQDLTQKIELRAEQLEDELGSMDLARDAAKKEFYGGKEQVMELKARIDKPVYVGGDQKTYLEMDYPEQDVNDFLDEAGGDMDVAEELASDARYQEEPEGELVDFLESLRQSAADHGVDASESIDQIYMSGMDGGMDADKIVEILRNDIGLLDAQDDMGRLTNHEVIRQAFEGAGYDGFIDQAPYKKWGRGSGRVNSMEGLHEGTEHVIPFKPNQLRKKDAVFDPLKIDSPDLLSSLIKPMRNYA